MAGQIAQLVEQRTENPRVGGSIPSLSTISKNSSAEFFYYVLSRSDGAGLVLVGTGLALASRRAAVAVAALAYQDVTKILQIKG